MFLFHFLNTFETNGTAKQQFEDLTRSHESPDLVNEEFLFSAKHQGLPRADRGLNGGMKGAPINSLLGGGFKYLVFSSLPGEMIHPDWVGSTTS